MRRAIVVLLMCVAIGQANGQKIGKGRETHNMATTPIMKILPFDENKSIKIQTVIGKHTMIEFQPGEQPISVPILSDKDHWTTTRLNPGENGANKDTRAVSDAFRIWIMPLSPDLSTPMTLVTNKRVYSFLVNSAAGGPYFQRVKFSYPDDEILERFNQSKITEQSRIKNEQNISTGLHVERINFNYEITGKGAIRPEQVFDDGERTWVRFTHGGEVPTILTLDANNKTSVPQFVVRDQFVVLPAVYPGLVFVLGSDVVRARNRRRAGAPHMRDDSDPMAILRNLGQ